MKQPGQLIMRKREMNKVFTRKAFENKGPHLFPDVRPPPGKQAVTDNHWGYQREYQYHSGNPSDEHQIYPFRQK
jgi:hypothetical protein